MEKLTLKNIATVYPKIKDKLSENSNNFYKSAVEPFLEIIDDLDEESMQTIEQWIEKCNKEISNAAKETKKTTTKTDKTTTKKTTKKAKVKKVAVKSSSTRGKLKVTNRRKGTSDYKVKAVVPKRKVNPLKDWQRILKAFVKMEGKTKDTWRVYAFVVDINKSFDSKLGKTTPHIDLITEVRDKLAKLCDTTEKKVTIENCKTLAERCAKAIKDDGDTFSAKQAKKKLSLPTLSGLGSLFTNAFGKKTKKKASKKTTKKTSTKKSKKK